MKNTLKIFFVFALLGIFIGCDNDSDKEPQPEIPEEQEVTFMDTASLKSVVLNLVEYIPTWKELERFTDVAERLALPAFEKRALAWSGLPGEEEVFDRSLPWMPQVIEYNKTIVSDFVANKSSALFNSVPPFQTPDGNAIQVPFPLDILDQRLRSITTLFLYENSLGLPVTLVNFYPPSVEIEKFATKTAFYQWFEQRFLPEKAAEAKAAEIMKAEKYTPLPLEFELLINEFGGIFNNGFLSNSSEEEILEFANDLKTKILTTVKAHYNGKVVVGLYNNYQRIEYQYWDRMSYAGFDEIHFAFFPPFDVETTNIYMDDLLGHNMKIVQNSGNIPWLASEISVFEWYVEEGKLLEYERAMYEAAFTKLENASIPPKGFSVAGGYMKTQAARDYVKNYFITH